MNSFEHWRLWLADLGATFPDDPDTGAVPDPECPICHGTGYQLIDGDDVQPCDFCGEDLDDPRIAITPETGYPF